MNCVRFIINSKGVGGNFMKFFYSLGGVVAVAIFGYAIISNIIDYFKKNKKTYTLHTIVLKTDGSLWTWGWNHYGQLGDGTRSYCNTTPKKIFEGGVTRLSQS
jgi:alpha-tubulin suppressor-like RCC1 family protein